MCPEENTTVTFISEGLLCLSRPSPTTLKIILEVDSGLCAFYRALVPPRFVCNPQRYAPHITVVRNEEGVIEKAWEALEAKVAGGPVWMSFVYSPVIKNDDIFWWLDCWSQDLTNFRRKLGLPDTHHLTRPPTNEDRFHTTIGKLKKLP